MTQITVDTAFTAVAHFSRKAVPGPSATAAVTLTIPVACVATRLLLGILTIPANATLVLSLAFAGGSITTYRQALSLATNAPDSIYTLLQSTQRQLNVAAAQQFGGFSIILGGLDITTEDYYIRGIDLSELNGAPGSQVVSNTVTFSATDLSGYPVGSIDAITLFKAYHPVTSPTVTLHSCVLNDYPGIPYV
jgi:hypothetical protein